MLLDFTQMFQRWFLPCFTSHHSSAFDELTMLDVGPSEKVTEKQQRRVDFVVLHTENSNQWFDLWTVFLLPWFLLSFPRKSLHYNLKLLGPTPKHPKNRWSWLPLRGLLLLNVFCFGAWKKNWILAAKTYCPLLFGDVDPHTFPPMVLFIDFLQLGKTSVYVGVLQVSHMIHHICKVSSNPIIVL